MNCLFFGGSSDIAISLAKKIKDVDAVTTNKKKGPYRKVYKLKNYNKNHINKFLKKLDKKYDNIIIFNGNYNYSFLSNFKKKIFLKDFEVNFLIPLKITSSLIQNNIINKHGSIFSFRL